MYTAPLPFSTEKEQKKFCNRLQKAFKKLVKEQNINEDTVGWYGDTEDNQYYDWIFEYERTQHRLRCDKRTLNVVHDKGGNYQTFHLGV